MRRLLRRSASVALAVPASLLLTIHAALAGVDARRRHKGGARPRLIFGPVPILSFKYMSRAMRAAGYEATTVVDELYYIHKQDDFDFVADRRALPSPGPGLLGHLARWLGYEYGLFAWAVERHDVFHCFFDGGFLRRTPLRYLEVQLLHLAGKRVIVMPYGGDVAVPSRVRSLAWRDGLMRNYPALGRTESRTTRWLDYYSRRADYIVTCVVHAETLPRWDLLTTHYYPIDTDAWARTDASAADGHGMPVVVVHAPNHRGLKGTEFLIKACEELRREGLEVELRLLERVPNAEVKAAMEAADIVAEEFLLGYALTAMEAMSLGRPVLSNLSEVGYYEVHRWSTGLDECPIVSTRPDEIADNLRRLVVDPELRRRLGQAGRDYVVRYHSYAAMAHLWDAIYRRVWGREDVDPREALPNRQAPG
jgi:glycosyltransferase involved in cell wall biosynthesis